MDEIMIAGSKSLSGSVNVRGRMEAPLVWSSAGLSEKKRENERWYEGMEK